MAQMKKKVRGIAARALPVLLYMISVAVQAFAVSADQAGLQSADIEEVNEVTGLGWGLVFTFQKFIVLMIILTLIITIGMEITKERVDLTAILSKVVWASAIGGTAYIVLDIIKAVWGAGINPLMIMGGG